MLSSILFVFISFVSTSFGQYSLTDCIQLAREKSNTSTIAKKSYLARKFRHSAYNADLYPQLILSGEVPGLVREIVPVAQDDGSQAFRTQSQLYTTGQLSLFQKIPYTGTQIYLSSGFNRIDILGSNSSSLWRVAPLQITMVQPIFQFNSLFWDLKMEELSYSASDAKFAEDMESLSYNVSQRFFDFYIAKMNLQNAMDNAAINDTLLKLSRGRFKVGKIAENDLLQSELAYMNSATEVEISKLDYEKSMHDLINFIGVEQDTITITPPLDIPNFEINVSRAISLALANQSLIVDFELDKMQAERTLEQVKRNNSLSAEITASYGLNQTASKIPDALEKLLDQERFNISLSIPIFQWGKGTANIEAAMLDRDRIAAEIDMKRRSTELEISFQIRQFTMLQTQVALSRTADTIAARRFDVAKNRYIIGTIDANTLFIAQSEKNAAFRAYIQTLKSFWLGLFNIRRITLFDFEKGAPIKYEIVN